MLKYMTVAALLLSIISICRAAAPTTQEVRAAIDALKKQGFPVIDFHIHLKGGLTIDEAVAMSKQTGIKYGVAVNCGVGFPVNDDKGAEEFFKSMQGQPVYIGMQAEGREWVKTFSPATIARFDYVFTDAMTFFDEEGRRTRLWIPAEVHIKDKQQFMEMLVSRIEKIMEEPIDIYANSTFIPAEINAEYDQLWTEARMKRVIDAAVRNGVAIEICAKYKIPSARFIKMAKAAGAKFSFGTNNGDKDLGQDEYCIQMVKECGLTAEDMFMPKPEGKKRVQLMRKP